MRRLNTVIIFCLFAVQSYAGMKLIYPQGTYGRWGSGAATVYDGIVWYQMEAGTNSAVITPDNSGRGNDGNVENAKWEEGTNGFLVGYGNYSFDGNNDLILTPYDSSMTGLTNGMTISFWMRPALTLISTADFLIGQYDASGNRMWKFEMDAGSDTFIFYTSADGSAVSGWKTGVGWTGLEWQHITLVYNNAPVQADNAAWIYVNGTLVAFTNNYANLKSFTDKTNNLAIATQQPSNFEYVGRLALLKVVEGTNSASTVAATNITQAAQLGILDGWSNSDREAYTNRADAIVTLNNMIQDNEGNTLLKAAPPTLGGTGTNAAAVGWGDGDGVNDHISIVVSTATNIMFAAGDSVTTMTNYAIINNVKYGDGVQYDWSNTYCEVTATSNTFWRYDGSSFYGGLISQIHCGDYTTADNISWHGWVGSNIVWNP